MIEFTRPVLAERGQKLVASFCRINNVPVPTFKPLPPRCRGCGDYRSKVIRVNVSACAHVGTAGRAWSWPGHSIDRTPYGVYAHETGHYFDDLFHLQVIRYQTGETPLTGYCPNDAEWVAEMMRLFITNPDLLRLVRPKTFEKFFLKFGRTEGRNWKTVLDGAPARTIELNERRVAHAEPLITAEEMFS